ncbi:unnamed protein product [Microthlaspi erraticum]|uniref:Uncharacterized protein n=1 Tax=Microthlaspi erraticum TaxID=1685480 RepID=A0A6D2IN08_9BRAS|nr:unnamed protein product [Microthlaspi erraticum]
MPEVVFPLTSRGFTELTTVIIDHSLTSPTLTSHLTCLQINSNGFIKIARGGAGRALRHLDLAFCEVSLSAIKKLRGIVRTVTTVHCPLSLAFRS